MYFVLTHHQDKGRYAMRKNLGILRTFGLLIVVTLALQVFVAPIFAQSGDATPEPTPEPTNEPVESAPAETAVTEATVATMSAAEMEAQIATYIANLDTVWMLIAAFLVFWMQAGFALVEAGFVRAKSIVNILMKNLFDFTIGSLGYWLLGFGIMFGAGNDFFGTEWFALSNIPDTYPGLTVPTLAFFFFQLVFAATAATIVSGAMAERTEFKGYLVFSAVISTFIYPVVGHWIWGGGWLAQLDNPFHDFAGSTVVHSTGGWLALIGAAVLGPRLGRFSSKGSHPIPGHNMTLATLGVFILWLGWFGFNPGSQLNSDAASIALVTVNTNIAAAAGAFTAVALGWAQLGKPQLPWGLNGALAGLVAITAPCAVVQPGEAILIGVIGSAVMYATVNFLESVKIDDPVGAVGVHLGAGIWGTLAVGIFGNVEGLAVGLLHGGGADQLITQVVGVLTVGAYVSVTGFILFFALKAIHWLRVDSVGETIGTDIYEHGLVAYPEFTNAPSEPVAGF
jgi:Amt family ammonium transporter